ncbi:PA14 domain-containing protein [Corallococcus sp. bb12-1]|uniref:PA14 domain-containing protein n=1 Tax=Corallococcus sp. bb12-1 TaxID=2996784 RepID=UPI00226DE06A|nr:PA14 domain-containing protein [Corallococcus sp. bb12-1]MCY1047262.1 PA14 domain-containing protein [Corallococcus sp. bb12-1]
MMQFVRSAWWVVLVTVGLMACGPQVENEATPDLQEATGEQSLGGSTCRPTTEPSVGTGLALRCTGQWEYRDLCFKPGSAAVCGSPIGYQPAQCDKTCRHPTSYARQTFSGTSAGVRRTETYCDYSERPPCVTTTTLNYSKTCADVAAEQVASLQAQGKEFAGNPLIIISATPGVPTYGPSRTIYNTPEHSIFDADFTQACSVVIDNVATAWATSQDAACGKETCNGAPIYPTCRHPDFGVESDPATCDALPTKGIRYSAQGQTLTELAAPSWSLADVRQDAGLPHRPVCLTADDVRYSNAQTKYDRLLSTWNRVPELPASSVDHLPLRRQLVDAFKVLFELQGHQLTSEQRDFILQHYVDYPDFNRLTRVDATIDFNWGRGSPSNAIAPDTFSARWTGEVLAPVTGTYTFETLSDDGVMLTVNDELLADQWAADGETVMSGTIFLTAGQRYPLSLDYFDQTGPALIQLRWMPPGTTTPVVIPASQLYLLGSMEHGLRAEYFDDVDFTSSNCGAWTPPTEAQTCTSTDTVDATLALCQRMAQGHVPVGRVASVWQWCMDAATSAAAVQCSGPSPYPQAWYTLTKALLQKDVVALQRDAVGGLVQSDLQARLSRINQWYGLARTKVFANDPAPQVLWKDLDAVFAELWKSAYAGGLLTDNSEQLKAADPFNTGLATDRVLLTAALTPMGGSTALPLEGAPLLLLLGDGLHGLHDRLADVSVMHDLGCRFMVCAGTPPVRTEVSELWNLLGALAEESTLNSALQGATNLALAPTERNAWRGLFELMRVRHATLRSAVTEVFAVSGYDKKLLLETPASRMPMPALRLSRSLLDGNTRTASYVKTGSFLPSARNSLRAGIQESKRGQLDDRIAQRIQELTLAQAEFTQHRSDYVSDRLAEMGNAQQLGSIQDQLKLRLTQFDQLSMDLVGLRSNAALEEAAFSDFATAFKVASESEQADLARLAITRGPVDHLSITAGEAHFVPGLQAGGVATYAVRQGASPWTRSANAGDIINVSARNQWAPTCVLSHAQLRKPLDAAGTLGGVNVNGALTGTEGFLVSFSDSAFTAESNAASKYAGASASARGCAGAKVESGAGWNFIVKAEASVYAYAEMCLAGEVGTRTSSDNSDGSDQRVSASYNTGIRLAGTPFPTLPAGALLLVQLEHDTHLLRDVQVVQPSMSVIIGRKAGLGAQQPDPGVDLYLVANDAAKVRQSGSLQDCTPDTSHALSVDVQRLVPAGTVVRQMAPAMAWVLTDMRAATEALVNQGRVLSLDMAARRQATQSALITACREESHCADTGTCNTVCDLSQFPPSLMSLYDTFVAKELARLERKVEIRAVERQMELATLDMKALSNDQAATEAQGRVLRLVPAWSLRNLDGEKLRTRTQNLSVLVTDYLYPVLDLRYPFVLEALKTRQAFQDLVRADWSQSYVGLADLQLNAVTEVTGALAMGRFQDPDPNYSLIALSFPRPGFPATASPWLKASPERSSAVWASLLDTSNPRAAFSVQLTPADFYTAPGGFAGALQCTDGTPILHRLGLYFVRSGGTSTTNENTTLNGQPLRASSIFEPELTFTGPQGLKTYYVEDEPVEGPKWRVGQSRILFGPSADAASTFQSRELTLADNQQAAGGDGLSPFVSARFDVTGLRTNPIHPLDAASELVLVLQVDRRTVVSMPQPLACQ